MTRPATCKRCGKPAQWLQVTEPSRKWVLLDSGPDGDDFPLCIDARGNLKDASRFGWRGGYRMHRCEMPLGGVS